MTTSNPHLNLAWAKVIVDQMACEGVTHFVISPGSRSTPLSVAVAQSDKVESTVHYDERGAAFFALGYARAHHKPAALICTSGSAVVNYFPALVEAAMDEIPVVVLTADRPPELHDRGANQTITQKGIYGSFVRASVSLPTPELSTSASDLRALVRDGVKAAAENEPGPVHFNCPFRKPLVPPPDQAEELEWIDADTPPDPEPPEIITAGEEVDDVTLVAEMIRNVSRGLLVVGRLRSAEERESVKSIASRLGWPVMADISSGLRLGENLANGIPYHDLLLEADAMPDMGEVSVLHLGGRVVSDKLPAYLKSIAREYYVVSDSRHKYDPEECVTRQIKHDVVEFCRELEPYLAGLMRSGLVTMMEPRMRKLDVLLDAAIEKEPTAEPIFHRVLSEVIPQEHTLFLANSLPVRYFNCFAATRGASIPTAVNRGASGIDGNLATACGFAHSYGRPLTAVIGDQAMLHDLNSLSLVGRLKQGIVIVMNNRGGRIFEKLPVSEYGDVLHKFFVAQHDFTFEHAAAQFGIEYTSVSDAASLKKTYLQAVESGSILLIECQIDSKVTQEALQRLYGFVRETCQ